MLNRTVRIRTSQLDHSANYDRLTDLPNRFLIMDRLNQAIKESVRTNHKLALLSIDIDGFKKINDVLGHQKGDYLLRELAQRIKELSGDGDSYGRIGGDQFVVIRREPSGVEDLAVLADMILHKINQSFKLEHQDLILTASVGIAIFPEDGETPEVLLKNSNSAAHFSKEQAQGSYAFYTENLNQVVSRRLELEQNMREALKRDEFKVFYQPKVDAKTKKITSFEALARWSNPKLGTVSPAEFIPIAEKNRLIESIDLFVLSDALRVLSELQKQYGENMSMAINLSPAHFRYDDFVSRVESIISNTSLNPQFIEFEITESMLISEAHDISSKLQKLEKLGVSLAIDDYGTGYSSLSYLRKYKFHTLKIDREFVYDISLDESARKIVAATISMAHQLDMKVVAEGVETTEQLLFLLDHDCDYIQGWLFSKAIPEEEVRSLFESGKLLME